MSETGLIADMLHVGASFGLALHCDSAEGMLHLCRHFHISVGEINSSPQHTAPYKIVLFQPAFVEAEPSRPSMSDPRPPIFLAGFIGTSGS